MTVSERELREQFERCFALPRGPARFAAIDAVLRQADAADYPQFAFDARMRAIDEFHTGGDPTRAFLAFSWCLARYDDQPELAGPGHEHDLLWAYKWMIGALNAFPEVPLQRTLTVLDDMQRRFALGGHSMHAIYQQRWEIAFHLGDTEAAAHWYDQFVTAKRDSLSDCGACVPMDQATYLASLGRYADAVEVAAPGLRGGCAHQPQRILAALLVPYLRTGRYDDAVRAHRDSYPGVRVERLFLGVIAEHLQFLGLTGNAARGLEILERHLSWLERPSTPFAAMRFMAHGAMLLGRLRDQGQGDLVIERLSGDGTRRVECTVDSLFAEFTEGARAIARRFDERNGNTHQSGLIEAALAEPPIVDRLPLTVLDGRPSTASAVRDAVDEVGRLAAAGDVAGAAAAKLRVARALRDAEQWADATDTAEQAALALGRAGLAADEVRARYLLFELYRRSWSTRDQAVAAVDDLVARLERLDGPGPQDVPDVRSLLIEAADELGGEEASRWRLRNAALCRAAGDETGERIALRQAFHVIVGAESRGEVFDILDRLDQLGPGPLDSDTALAAAAAVDVSTARLRLSLGDPDAALAALTAAAQRYEAAGPSPERDLSVGTWRARTLLELGRPAEAQALARDLINAEDDADYYAWNARIVVARALRAQGREEESAAYTAEENLPQDLTYDDWDDDDLNYLHTP